MSDQDKTPRSFEDIYADLCDKFDVRSVGIEVGDVGASLGTAEKPYVAAFHGRQVDDKPSQIVFTIQQDVWAGFVEAHDSYADTWDAAQRFLAEKESIPVFQEGS